jgi:hypothetical protein
MPTIRVFEPALCCNTGVCGPDVDQELVDFTADLNYLKKRGVDIERHNLANDPGAFASEESVRGFLQVAGSEGLPLTLVDGVTVMTGAYPTRDQLSHYAGINTGTGTGTDTGTDTGVDTRVVPAGVAELGLSEAGGCGCGSGECC